MVLSSALSSGTLCNAEFSFVLSATSFSPSPPHSHTLSYFPFLMFFLSVFFYSLSPVLTFRISRLPSLFTIILCPIYFRCLSYYLPCTTSLLPFLCFPLSPFAFIPCVCLFSPCLLIFFIYYFPSCVNFFLIFNNGSISKIWKLLRSFFFHFCCRCGCIRGKGY